MILLSHIGQNNARLEYQFFAFFNLRVSVATLISMGQGINLRLQAEKSLANSFLGWILEL
jgi:hypothetical protein